MQFWEQKTGKSSIVCQWIGGHSPISDKPESFFNIAYEEPSATLPVKTTHLYVEFETKDDVVVSLTLNKHHQAQDLLNTLTTVCDQLGIKMLTEQGTLIDIHEFRSTPEKIEKLIPIFKEKLLQNRWGYDTQEKKYRLLPEFLDILYNKIKTQATNARSLQNTFS